MMSARLAAAGVLLLSASALAQPGAPAAAVPPTPQVTTASFGDWVLRCARPAAAAKTCELVQVVQQDGKPVAQVAIGALAKGQPLRLTMLVPPSVTFGTAPALLPPGGDGASLSLAWRRCLPGGCVAEAEIGTEALPRMRSWTQAGRIVFADGGGRAVALPFSPLGLPQALDALIKEDAG